MQFLMPLFVKITLLHLLDVVLMHDVKDFIPYGLTVACSFPDHSKH